MYRHIGLLVRGASLLLLGVVLLHSWPSAAVTPLDVRLLSRVMARRGLTPDPSPDGKTVGRIVVVVQEVFTPDDPFPPELNHLHARTREEVVRRELLIQEGEVYDKGLVRESARNLRALGLFSVVLVAPVRAEASDRVDLLVFVKDLFSIRLEWNFQSTGLGLERLRVSLAELNMGGYGKQARLVYGMDRGKWLLGQSYVDPRVWGSRWAGYESAEVYFPRLEPGGPEGGAARVGVVRPLATTRTRWGGRVEASLSRSVVRGFQGGEPLVWDDPTTAQVEAYPWSYVRDAVSGSGTVVRSFGAEVKTNLTAGLGYRLLAVSPEVDPGPGAAAEYHRWMRLPEEERAMYAVVGMAYFSNHYEVFHDLDTFGLSEDRRIGGYLGLTLRRAVPLFEDMDRWWELDAVVSYRLLTPSRCLLYGGLSFSTRLDRGDWIDNRLVAQVKLYSAQTKIGRIVFRSRLDLGWDDHRGTYVTVGGDDGLRGYLSGSRIGTSAIRNNLELRSKPVDLDTIQLGWALFWDGGDAFDDQSQIHYRHSVGGGLRILLPQSNRSVIRLDLGLPLSGPESGPAGWLFAGFKQAF